MKAKNTYANGFYQLFLKTLKFCALFSLKISLIINFSIFYAFKRGITYLTNVTKQYCL